MEEELHELSNDCDSVTEVIDTDPLEFTENLERSNDEDENSQDKNSSNNNFINDIVSSVLERIKNPFGRPEFILDTIKHHPVCQEKNGRTKRNNKETREQREVRLLRQRMLQMKSRFLVCLELPHKAEEEKKRWTEIRRMKRKKEQEMETPEQTAARKKHHAERMRMTRKRLLALETPEQTAERIVRRNEKKKLRLQERLARETPEERAARRQREKANRERLSEKYKVPHGLLAAKTGKIRTIKTSKQENSASGEMSLKPEEEPRDFIDSMTVK